MQCPGCGAAQMESMGYGDLNCPNCGHCEYSESDEDFEKRMKMDRKHMDQEDRTEKK